MTKSAQRVSARIAQYKSNPARGTKRAAAVKAKAKAKAGSKPKSKSKSKRAPARSAAVSRLKKAPRLPKKRATATKGRVGASVGASKVRRATRTKRPTKAQLRARAVQDAQAALVAEYGTADLEKVAEIKRQREAAAGAAKKGADMAAAKKRKGKKGKKRKTAAKAAATAAPAKKRKSKGKRKSKSKRKSKAAAKGVAKRSPAKRKKRRAKAKRTTSGPTINIKLPGAPRVEGVAVKTKKRPKKKRKSNPADMLESTALMANPYGDAMTHYGLFENPAGPFSVSSLGAFGLVSAGLGLGLTGARLVDRLVATRTPKTPEGGSATARHPWYGRSAALATLRRPDGWRFAAQAGGAIGGIGLAYLTRNMTILPWLAGGTALGFGANIFLMGLEYYIMPTILKVEKEDQGKPSLGNRLYAFEQGYVQDGVDKAFETWPTVGALAQGQLETPVITSPLNAIGTDPVILLGNAQREIARLTAQIAQLRGNNGGVQNTSPFADAAVKNADGRVGNGDGGGCGGGCDDTPAGCVDCNEQSGVPRQCNYTVQRGDKLIELIATTGFSVSDIDSMNDGQSTDAYWYPGNTVTLPRAICLKLVNRAAPAQRTTSLFPAPQEFQQGAVFATVPGLPGTEVYDLSGYVPDASMFARAHAQQDEDDDED